MSAALQLRWRSYGKSDEEPVPDSQVPDTVSWVTAEILSPATPRHVARAAAEEHQALQHGGFPMPPLDPAAVDARAIIAREVGKLSPADLTAWKAWDALLHTGLARRVGEALMAAGEPAATGELRAATADDQVC